MDDETRRLILHEKLCEALGARNVYYQPPANVQMKYPAIVYSLSSILVRSADNSVYGHHNRYNCLLIEREAVSPLRERLLNIPLCSFDRSYVADNLYHYSFNVFD